MGLTINLHDLTAVVLFTGHVLVAVSYLGIAWVLQLFVANIGENAKLIARMFSLFSYFIAGCGLQHLCAALLFIYPMWTLYIALVWITGLLAMFTLGFIWRVRPPAIPKHPIVVVPS